MEGLVKINKMLVNLDGFAAFEFQDELQCLWAYLPSAPNHQFEYVSFVIDNFDEYSAIKMYIEQFLLNAHPEGVTKPTTPQKPKLGAPKPPSTKFAPKK
tara:strand:+ start:49 stop:345 length:297 start_codon:yes stop_codon:yes gene_type:complete